MSDQEVDEAEHQPLSFQQIMRKVTMMQEQDNENPNINNTPHSNSFGSPKSFIQRHLNPFSPHQKSVFTPRGSNVFNKTGFIAQKLTNKLLIKQEENRVRKRTELIQDDSSQESYVEQNKGKIDQVAIKAVEDELEQEIRKLKSQYKSSSVPIQANHRGQVHLFDNEDLESIMKRDNKKEKQFKKQKNEKKEKSTDKQNQNKSKAAQDDQELFQEKQKAVLSETERSANLRNMVTSLMGQKLKIQGSKIDQYYASQMKIFTNLKTWVNGVDMMEKINPNSVHFRDQGQKQTKKQLEMEMIEQYKRDSQRLLWLEPMKEEDQIDANQLTEQIHEKIGISDFIKLRKKEQEQIQSQQSFEDLQFITQYIDLGLNQLGPQEANHIDEGNQKFDQNIQSYLQSTMDQIVKEKQYKIESSLPKQSVETRELQLKISNAIDKKKVIQDNLERLKIQLSQNKERHDSELEEILKDDFKEKSDDIIKLIEKTSKKVLDKINEKQMMQNLKSSQLKQRLNAEFNPTEIKKIQEQYKMRYQPIDINQYNNYDDVEFQPGKNRRFYYTNPHLKQQHVNLLDNQDEIESENNNKFKSLSSSLFRGGSVPSMNTFYGASMHNSPSKNDFKQHQKPSNQPVKYMISHSSGFQTKNSLKEKPLGNTAANFTSFSSRLNENPNSDLRSTGMVSQFQKSRFASTQDKSNAFNVNAQTVEEDSLTKCSQFFQVQKHTHTLTDFHRFKDLKSPLQYITRYDQQFFTVQNDKKIKEAIKVEDFVNDCEKFLSYTDRDVKELNQFKEDMNDYYKINTARAVNKIDSINDYDVDMIRNPRIIRLNKQKIR